MVVKSEDELYSIVLKILLAAGADEANAEGVAEHLVSANLCGVDTHGIFHLPRYINNIKDGSIVANARPQIVKETSTSALVNGNLTFGHVVAKFAMEAAIKKAKENGMAVVALVNSNHIGRLGYYAEMGVAEGMMAMVWAGGYGSEIPVAAPYGGRERALHTNPVAMGFPAGAEAPMVSDFATTAIAGTKVAIAQQRKSKLPPGSIVDKDGKATTEPNDFHDGGAHLPFGGYKGYAVMLASEFLGRVFSGSDDFSDPNRGDPIMRHQGVTMIAFKADLFGPLADYKKRADEMGQKVRQVAPAPDFEEVLIPGDPETRTRAIRKRDGIPIADDIWESITEVAAELIVEI